MTGCGSKTAWKNRCIVQTAEGTSVSGYTDAGKGNPRITDHYMKMRSVPGEIPVFSYLFSTFTEIS